MIPSLMQEEARVLGSLIEKDLATPDQYPLSLNALTMACNQKTSREPVTSYSDEQVRETLRTLQTKGLTVEIQGGRAYKYEHRIGERLNLGRGELALLAVLMLRGPQTLNELKERTSRMHAFDEIDSVVSSLKRLPEGMVVELGRRPGWKESRWAQLLTGEVNVTEAPKIRHEIPRRDNEGMDTQLTIAGRSFRSRLMIGTGKYRSFPEMARCHEASGAEIVTVAVRRVNLTDKTQESLLDYIDRSNYFILPNTAGCYTAEEAIRTARLAREALDTEWVKLEVIGDKQTLFPDNEGLLEATRVLSKEGFVVLPYTTDDLINARRLVDAGAAAVMPLGAPIGSGMGIQNPANLRIMREMITEVPLIVDAGVGTASDACVAMELGYEGVLLNTAVAEAEDAVSMAAAMHHAVAAGRLAFLAGRMPKRLYASASSPLAGVVR